MFGVSHHRKASHFLSSIRAAIDLASIMVGVIVIGLIAGVISATVFAVIPWAQDEAAKGSLDAVRTAESAYAGMSAAGAPAGGGGHGTGFMTAVSAAQANYGDASELDAAGLLKTGDSLTVSTNDVNSCYVGVSESQTGRLFFVTSRTAAAQEVKPDTDTSWCADMEGVVSGIEGAVMPGVFYPANAMVSTWDTSLPGCSTIKVPAIGEAAYTVNWGDDSTETKTGSVGTADQPNHTYSAPHGPRTVVIEGRFSHWAANTPDWSRNCVTEVTKWGNTGTTNLSGAFARSTSIRKVTEIPPTTTDLNGAFAQSTFNGDVSKWKTSNVTDFTNLFENNTAFNQPVKAWNTSKATTLVGTFRGATAFNQPVDDWNTSNVTSMEGTFANASAFNQTVSKWNTSKVTNMSSMFTSTGFNHSLATNGSSWDVSKVTTTAAMLAHNPSYNQPFTGWRTDSLTDTASMFYNSKFNQPVENLDVSKVTDMMSMFYAATAFNQPLGAWDVSSVKDFSTMFTAAGSFNQPLDSWDTSNAVWMNAMFMESGYNKPLSSWDTSNVKTMAQMFNNSAVFNQPIHMWDVSKLESTSGMFQNNYVFNQPLAAWNTVSLQDASSMFRSSVFNQDISGWNVSKVWNKARFAEGASLIPAYQPVFP